MRRDYFTLNISTVDAPGRPTLHIGFDGPSDQLTDRLTDGAGEPLAASDVDVSYRLQDDETGVLAVTNRVTGSFILELNAPTETVLGFVGATRNADDSSEDSQYRLRIDVNDETAFDWEKQTFLVYDSTGDIVRDKSLIPSGVEL